MVEKGNVIHRRVSPQSGCQGQTDHTGQISGPARRRVYGYQKPGRLWQALEEKLNALPMTNEKARSLKRFLLGSAAICELDKQGRILLPQVLRDRAGLDKDITLLGVGDHIEIWNTSTYEEKYSFDDEAALEADWEGLGV